MITTDVSCRLLEILEGMTRGSFGDHRYTKVFPTRDTERVSEQYLRRLFGDRLVDQALQAGVLIRD